ncbi:hypothetical protein BDY24DRAFT_40359 [Mrakia frigida]|uniref:uncharacterized protein n=1 Tax=Mrakia frigida TaxID=29902 RepID=UPI003FCC1098
MTLRLLVPPAFTSRAQGRVASLDNLDSNTVTAALSSRVCACPSSSDDLSFIPPRTSSRNSRRQRVKVAAFQKGRRERCRRSARRAHSILPMENTISNLSQSTVTHTDAPGYSRAKNEGFLPTSFELKRILREQPYKNASPADFDFVGLRFLSFNPLLPSLLFPPFLFLKTTKWLTEVRTCFPSKNIPSSS